MHNRYEESKAIVKKNQAENNRKTIRDYRLKELDSKKAISNYTTEIKRVTERKKHLTVVKESNETSNS